MKIHTYEKVWLVAAFVLIITVFATVTYGTVGLGIAMIDDSEDTVDPGALSEEDGFDDPGVTQVGENEYDVYVISQQFTYNPGGSPYEPIELPEDSEVTFYVTSQDVIHSFSLVGTNVNTMVVPGEVATMTVEFDGPEEYGIVCNEYCGPLHHNMEGLVQVVPEEDFHLFTIEDIDAPDEVELGDSAEFPVSVSSDHHDERTTTVTFEAENETAGEEITLEEDLVIDGHDTAETTFAVDTDDFGTGDFDWTVTVEDETESGSVAVLEDLEEDE
ncbi:cytochrome c oxidase subunit II [Natrialbaceae archaeon A-gly3]